MIFLYKIVIAVTTVLSAVSLAAAGNFEQELLSQINNYRATEQLKPLSPYKKYEKLAREHNLAMQQAGKLSHDGFKERFNRAKADLCVENVGWNHPTATSQFKGWKDSSGHNKNMLDPEITKAGISKTGPYVTFFACQ